MLTQATSYPQIATRLELTGLEPPPGLPSGAGQGCATLTPAPVVRPLRPKARHDDLPKFASQRRADWWAELAELASREVTLRTLQPADAGALVTTLGSPAVEEYISPGPATLDEARGFIDWTHRARQLCNSRSHSQSWTSRLRPGTCVTWRALTSGTSRPRASRMSEIGIQ